ncbi:MAG: M23 family metallopeptidase [Spirosomataceae bacterium]
MKKTIFNLQQKKKFIGIWLLVLASAIGFSLSPFRFLEYSSRFEKLLVQIQREEITPEAASKEFAALFRALHLLSPPLDSTARSEYEWAFPLINKNYSAIGGGGRGFRPMGFNLFNHRVRGSHPAHDIFIYDRNHDDKEDGSGAYVPVISMGDGLVIATEKHWNDSLQTYGGNYVWMYDFQTGGVWYYAHLREVYVEKSQVVKKGMSLGLVGRTGKNAAAARSDTHLHLMYLEIDDQGAPIPINTYNLLKEAKTWREPAPAERHISAWNEIQRLKPKEPHVKIVTKKPLSH